MSIIGIFNETESVSVEAICLFENQPDLTGKLPGKESGDSSLYVPNVREGRSEYKPVDDVTDEAHRIEVWERRRSGEPDRAEPDGHDDGGEDDPEDDSVADAETGSSTDRVAEPEHASHASEDDSEDDRVEQVGDPPGRQSLQSVHRWDGGLDYGRHLHREHRAHDDSGGESGERAALPCELFGRPSDCGSGFRCHTMRYAHHLNTGSADVQMGCTVAEADGR